MSDHLTVHERLRELAHPHEPNFEPSNDPILREFAALFADSELVAFAADRRLRVGRLSTTYDCETLSLRDGASEPDKFLAVWTPVWHTDDPLTGFRTGRDSSLVGSTITVAMPQDERTSALLLLVTSTFVHLSARYENGMPLVQGAIETDSLDFRFVTLDPTAADA